MFTIGEKDYELHFNIGRCKLIERATGKSVVAMLALDNNYQMSIADADAFFRYGLKEAGADSFVAPKIASDLCERYMEEYGYTKTVALIIRKLAEDMGFLFRQG